MISSIVAPAFKRVSNVPPRAGGVHVRVGGVEGDAQKLDILRRQDSARVDPRAGRHELVGPYGIELIERIPRRVPLADGLHLVARGRWCGGLCRRPRAHGLRLFQQNRRAEAAGMDRHHRCTFQHEKDFLFGGTGGERLPNVPSRSLRVQVRTSGVHRDADQLDQLAATARRTARGSWPSARRSSAQAGSHSLQLRKRVVPRTGFRLWSAYAVSSWSRSVVSLATGAVRARSLCGQRAR